MNTGLKQATIAYRTAKTSGAALDVNGELTTISGRRQAILLLQGRVNPNPAIYEVVGYFTAGSVVDGNPTFTYDNLDCPVDYIRISPLRIILTADDPVKSAELYSSRAWSLTSGGTNAALNITSGAEGTYNLEFTYNGVTAQQDYTFTNSATLQTATIRVVSAETKEWVLEDGTWNNNGFWFNDGIWNY